MIPATRLKQLQALDEVLMEPQEVQALAELAADVAPTQEIVEIGSWAGGSAAWLSAGSHYGKGAHITCIDPWEDWRDPPADRDMYLGADALARFNQVTDARHVTALRARSLDVARAWVKPIGLLFIDGSHTYEDCRDDYLAWAPFMPAGALLAVHDYWPDPPPELWWCEGPTKAVDEYVGGTGEWEPLGPIGAMWVGRRR